MKKVLKTIGLFALLFFALIALLFFLGKFFPYSPSFLNSEYLIPITLIYLGLFFGIKYFRSYKKKS